MKKLLLLFALNLLSMIVNATVLIDGIYYDIYEVSCAAAVTSFDSDPSLNGTVYTGTIVIPQSITYKGKEYEVRSISSKAFYGCSNMTSITIPNSVTAIGSSAFQGCSGLASVIIPNSVTTIGEKTFESCSGLKSVNIGSKVSSINNNVFSDCINLTSVTLHTFADLTSSEEHNIKNVFGEQVKEYVIGQEISSIYNDAFSNCSELSSVIICDGVERIGDGAFRGCVNLNLIAIPNTVTSIGDYAFWFCSGLTSISLGNNIKTIGNGAFTECSSLSSINIPSSVTDIGNCIFSHCESLTSITVDQGNKEYDSRDNCNAIIESNSNVLKFGCKNTTIPYSITSIGVYAFYNCSGLTAIDIPNCVTKINDYAFNGCSHLATLSIPNSVTSIGDYAFADCNDLASINIPNSVTSIGNWAFWSCYSLTSITIPNSMTTISNNTFVNCKGLISINIPNSVNSIGERAFSGCIGLTSIIIPNSVTSIGEGAFSGCKGLISISIPNSITNISVGLLSYCTNLTSVSIPSSVTSIGKGAFSGCSALASLMIPNSVTSIGKYAFEDCSSLTSIIIPKKVTRIYEGTFSYCSALTSITIPKSVEYIYDNAFSGCRELKSVTTKNRTPITIKYETFPNCNNASLYVPTGSKKEYQNTKTNYWYRFKEIVEYDLPSHRLTYVVDGVEYKIYTIEEDAPITPELEPTKEGYTFSGWIGLPEIMPDHDVVVEGIYTINKYKLTYMVDGAEYKRYDVEYGAAITPEPAPTKDGYLFSGWSDIPATMPANDVVVTGSFSAIEIKQDKGEFTATSGSTAELSNDNNVSGEYEIPETVTHDGVTYTVTSIGNEAFKDNTSLTDVTIPSTIISIGERAFAECSNLKSITVNSTTPIAFSAASRTRGGSSVFEGVDKNTCVLYVPEGTVDAYRAAAVWGEFTNILVIGSSGINGIILDGKTFDVYDLKGRMIKTNTTSLDGLPKGVYIIGGKKVLK